jgi:hypothetical protein
MIDRERRGSGRRFALALAAYGLLVLILGLPILIGDCGIGVDGARRCAAARRMVQVYELVALMVPLAAAWLLWRGSKKAMAVLLGGSLLPLAAALLFGELAY